MKLVALIVVAGTCLWPGLAQSANRYALVIGSDRGHAGEATLRFAGADARRVSEVLQKFGQFPPENVVLLEDPGTVEVRGALARLNARIRTEACSPDGACLGSVLLVFYSGHADALALHLGTDTMPWEELRDITKGSSADLRVLVVDACRSGAATRVKGLQPSEPFALPLDQSQVEGFVVLSSAAAGEEAQESDELQGSFFTHHFLSALRGAADADVDSKVTLEEAYAYTTDRTIASTATTVAGIQHPTFNFEMSGKAKLVLTWLESRRNQSALLLPKQGIYLLHRGDGPESPLEMEAHVPDKPRTVMLSPGTYFIRYRTPETMREGKLVLAAGEVRSLPIDEFSEVEFTELVRKGFVLRNGWEGAEIPPFHNAYTLKDSEWKIGLVHATGMGIADRFQFTTSFVLDAIGFLNLFVKWNFLRSAAISLSAEIGGGYWFPFDLGYAQGEVIATLPLHQRLFLSFFGSYEGFFARPGDEDAPESDDVEPLSLLGMTNGLRAGVELELVTNPHNVLLWEVYGSYSIEDQSFDTFNATFAWAHRWEVFAFMLGMRVSTASFSPGELSLPFFPVLDLWWRW